MDESVKKVRRGVFVYPHTWRGFDSIVFSSYGEFTTHLKYKGKFSVKGHRKDVGSSKREMILHRRIYKEISFN
jgi:hypothetical protein